MVLVFAASGLRCNWKSGLPAGSGGGGRGSDEDSREAVWAPGCRFSLRVRACEQGNTAHHLGAEQACSQQFHVYLAPPVLAQSYRQPVLIENFGQGSGFPSRTPASLPGPC